MTPIVFCCSSPQEYRLPSAAATTTLLAPTAVFAFHILPSAMISTPARMPLTEDPELCDAWRNTGCKQNYMECKRNGVTKCVSISHYCSLEDPHCEGNLDLRVCMMLEAGKINKLDQFSLLGDITGNNLNKSIELARQFNSAVPNTISHDRCPQMYTLVGDHCLSFLNVGRMSWGEARAFCSFLDGELLKIKNTSHFVQIVRHLNSLESASDFWIGGSIPNTTVGWTWLDGSPMEMGTPLWATRYSRSCIQRNVTTATSDSTCHHYYQAPEEVTKGECASLSFEHSFYMTDEDCLREMSPLCVYQGRDFPKSHDFRGFVPLSQPSGLRYNGVYSDPQARPGITWL